MKMRNFVWIASAMMAVLALGCIDTRAIDGRDTSDGGVALDAAAAETHDASSPGTPDGAVQPRRWREVGQERALALATLGDRVISFGRGTAGPLDETREWDGVTWRGLSPSSRPPERRGHAMATRGSKVVLFGGAAGGAYLSDTWEWDGTAWATTVPPVSPPARSGHAMASLGDKVILFGGSNAEGVLGDTWQWDGSTWTELASPVSPPARSGHAMASLHGTITLFGGSAGDAPLGDTWIWTGAAWTQRVPLTSPAGRCGHAMTTLGARVLLFGGVCAGAAWVDTWGWDGTAWMPLGGDDENWVQLAGLALLDNPAMATVGDGAVLVGDDGGMLSDTWSWSGTQWSPLEPPATPLFGAALARLGDKIVAFGGWRLGGTFSDGTWEWDGSNWRLLAPPVRPPARAGHAMASLGDKVILFGGGTAAGVLDDTWEWDGSNWRPLAPTRRPPARSRHAMATLGDRVLLFAGEVSGNNTDPSYFDDTWEWDGLTWTQLAPPVSPDARSRHSMATVGNKVVLFGGAPLFNGVPVRRTVSNDTWEWDGSNWTRLTPATRPPARHGAAMATCGEKAVMFGGNGQQAPSPQQYLRDMWEWDGSTWKQLPPSGPSTRSDHAMVTLGSEIVLVGGTDGYRRFGDESLGRSIPTFPLDTWTWDGQAWRLRSRPIEPPVARIGHAMASLDDELVLFGGENRDELSFGSGMLLDETWRWDGTAWRRLAPAVGPSARAGHAMARLGNVIILFGGYGEQGALDDTWRWDGTTWTELHASARPTARGGHAMVTVGDKIMLFGGAAVANLVEARFHGAQNDTWEWDGATWTQASPSLSPSPRGGHAMATVEGVVVAFGGDGGAGPLGDTWQWDGASWMLRDPSTNPRARSGHAMAALDGKVVLSSGDETWEWDGTTWTVLDLPGSPAARTGHAMAAFGDRIVLFGGRGSDRLLDGTWLLGKAVQK
jgi:N-acetylneuraminic acid mutarotase